MVSRNIHPVGRSGSRRTQRRSTPQARSSSSTWSPASSVPSRLTHAAPNPSRASATHALLSAPPWVTSSVGASPGSPDHGHDGTHRLAQGDHVGEVRHEPPARELDGAPGLRGDPVEVGSRPRGRAADERAPQPDADGPGLQPGGHVRDRDPARRDEPNVRERPAQRRQVARPPEARREQLHDVRARRDRRHDLGGAEHAGDRRHPALEPFPHDLGDQSRAHEEAGAGVRERPGLLDGADRPRSDRSALAARPADLVQRARRVGGDLDRPDPTRPERVDDGAEVAGLPVAEDREDSVVFERGHGPSLVLTGASGRA